MKRKDCVIIWPQYFDKSFSRSRGRRVPLKQAVESPSINDLIKAAAMLKYSFEVERDVRYPTRWWSESGRLLIKRVESKSAIIKKLSKLLAGK